MDGLTQFFLRPIDFSSIEMVIAQLHCVLRRIDQLPIDPGLLRGLIPCSPGAIRDLYDDD